MQALLTRVSAAAIAIVMVGAIFAVHVQFGFFMNWFGAKSGEGFEYHLLAIGLAVALTDSAWWRLVDGLSSGAAAAVTVRREASAAVGGVDNPGRATQEACAL